MKEGSTQQEEKKTDSGTFIRKPHRPQRSKREGKAPGQDLSLGALFQKGEVLEEKGRKEIRGDSRPLSPSPRAR